MPGYCFIVIWTEIIYDRHLRTLAALSATLVGALRRSAVALAVAYATPHVSFNKDRVEYEDLCVIRVAVTVTFNTFAKSRSLPSNSSRAWSVAIE